MKWPRKRTQPARRVGLETVLNAEEDARFEAGLYNAREAGAQAGRQHGRLPLARRPFQHALPPRSLHLRVQLKAEMNGARKSRFSSQLRFTGRR